MMADGIKYVDSVEMEYMIVFITKKIIYVHQSDRHITPLLNPTVRIRTTIKTVSCNSTQPTTGKVTEK